LIDEAPFYVQHELFPLDRPEPVASPPQPPRERKTEPATPPDEPDADEDIELVMNDEAPEPEPAARLGSLPMVVEYRLPRKIPAAPKGKAFPLGAFAAGMSAMSLLLAVIALGVGIHASRTRSTHGEDVVLARLAGVAAGVDPSSVAVDAGHQRLQARAVRIPGAELSTYQALEQRVQAQAPGWTVMITPPLQPVPAIRFADGEDDLSAGGKRTVEASAWAARRWGFATIGVPGYTDPRPLHPLLPRRRAEAVASLLAQLGVRATPLPAEGQSFRLHLTWPQQK
jgi:outer membrane protein OmpA-like peptidoglycan-associated protein